jgi:hypothetical protein
MLRILANTPTWRILKKNTDLGMAKKKYNHNSHNFQTKKHMFKSKMRVNVKVSHTIYKKYFNF